MEYIIWLQIVLGFANARAKKIIDHFGSAENVFKSCKATLLNSKLLTKGEISKMDIVTLSSAFEIISECSKSDITIIPYGSKKYPYCLSVLPDAPLVIYVKGKMLDFDNVPAVCIVGPRKVSEFGKKAAFSLSFRLAASGITIVSGGALGTDTFAHAGALKSGGSTVICLGCGINSNYLSKNENLRKAVVQSGCLISEYPPATPATRYTFPERNRIMSALTLGTVVIEAGEKSGALITAGCANEQGKDVFVIPGQPKSREYMGSNALLRDGAKPLLDVDDIFSEYILQFPDKIHIEKAYVNPIISNDNSENKIENHTETINFEKSQKKITETLSKEAKIVYNHLDKEIFLPEEINVSEINSQQLLTALIELEINFLIKSLPGGRYEKC